VLLQQRNLQPELMDDPALERQSHVAALQGLARINQVSLCSSLLWRPIRRFAERKSTSRLRVLDIASGGGDVPIDLWKKADKAGLRLDIVGCDISDTAVQHANAAADAVSSQIRFEQRDVVRTPPLDGYDVVTCSLFLHHLAEPEAVSLLRAMSSIATGVMLVSDLRRSVLGYLLAVSACFTLSRCRIVHVDGPRSVAGAFTVPEVRDLCRQSGLDRAHISTCWPCRFLLEWKASRAV